MTIWEFPLAGHQRLLHSDQQIAMPEGAKILCVQVQHGTPCLWALVDPQAPMKLRHVHIAGTGHPMPNDWPPYVGTFQVSGGSLVFHVFA